MPTSHDNILTHLENLLHLEISYNRLERNLKLNNLKQLSYLSIRHNKIASELPMYLSELTALIILQVDNNQLTGNVTSIQQLTNLELLNIRNNQFSQPENEIIYCFQHLTKLKYLSFGVHSQKIANETRLQVHQLLPHLKYNGFFNDFRTWRFYETNYKDYHVADAGQRFKDQLYYSYKRSKYMLFNRAWTSWFHANTSCFSIEGGGYHLLKIDNKDESDAINTFLSSGYYGWNGVWIGLNDLETPNLYKWELRNESINMSFSNFLPGEPNKLHPDENCIQMLTRDNGMWNDYECDEPLDYFICELEIL